MEVIHEHKLMADAVSKFAFQYARAGRSPRGGDEGTGGSGGAAVPNATDGAKRAASLYQASGAKLHPKRRPQPRRVDDGFGGGGDDGGSGAPVRFLHASPSELTKLGSIQSPRRLKLSAARVRHGPVTSLCGTTFVALHMPLA